MSTSDAPRYEILWEQFVLDADYVKSVVAELETNLAKMNNIGSRVNARRAAIELAVVVQFEDNGRARPFFVDEQPPEYVLVREAIEIIFKQMGEGVALTASNRHTMAAGILINLLAARGET